MSPTKVSLVSEQLLQPVPGGIGAYVRALVRRLPPYDVAVEPVVAWHGQNDLHDAALSQARRLPVPRRLLYRRWSGGGRPGVGGDASLVHAPSLAFPPHDGRPLVVTVHDVTFLEMPEAFTDAGVDFHRASLERLADADVVIAPSKATADALAGLDGDLPHVEVIPQGTDMSAPAEDERDRILDHFEVERPYVLWRGTVEPRKNPEGVIRGFVAAVESGVPRAEELNLYLAGPPGWWQGDVAEFVTDKGMEDRVRRLGSQPEAVLPALYAGAEAFVFPSFAEGFGLPVLEAMACGSPVVTSNRSSLPEVAGAAAELCDPDDPESIGRALAKVLRDADLAADLRRLGLERARELTWSRTAQRTAAVYRDLLARGA